MGRFDQKMREVERSLAQLTGNKAQAAGFRKGLEKKIQQAAVKALPKIAEKLVKGGHAGWANDPDTPGGAVLVERGTGCVLQDPKGKVFQRKTPVSHPPTPGINEAAFIQHLKDAGNELFVPYMYLDKKGNVTVGIGTHLENAQEAKDLSFFIRGTNKPAHDNHKINAYNKVKNSGLAGSKHFVFEPLTSIEISEADAVLRASKDLLLFLDDLKRQRFFRELDTFPVTAKMGLLDMIYTLGLPNLLAIFKRFNPAVRKRDWNFAATESDRGSDVSSQRNQIVYQWFKEAERQEPFFVSVVCTKRIDLFFQ
ncbi:MAG: hypothetical protein IH900_05520 [Proteobacteria bacterium]|nr:hypothetical protein [Pseudomonadota bacterium]